MLRLQWNAKLQDYPLVTLHTVSLPVSYPLSLLLRSDCTTAMLKAVEVMRTPGGGAGWDQLISALLL